MVRKVLLNEKESDRKKVLQAKVCIGKNRGKKYR